jgi:7-cyano-7-deazaguanine synthase
MFPIGEKLEPFEFRTSNLFRASDFGFRISNLKAPPRSFVPMIASRPAVVLLSGGLDSATTLAIARSEGFACHAISFHYGQRHAVELAAAAEVARLLGAASHRTIAIDLAQFGGSALTTEMAVPKRQGVEQIGKEIPITYVPARNTVFLSFALAFAEMLEASDIFLGVNALDYSGYPDCRPEYIAAFERLANLATKAAVEGRQRLVIRAPLLSLTKAEIIRRGLALGIDYARTSSCYDPDASGAACGQCDACLLRLKGFAENGVADPGRYG